MARDGAVYACQSCGAVQTKWAGQCPACGAWNTLVEELQARPPGAMAPSKASRARGLAFQGLEDETPAPPRIPTGPDEMWSYPVEGPGKLGKGKVFCTLKGKDGKKGTGGDGLTIDTKGNVYITSSIGVQVFDPMGKHLGTIEFPEQPSNCTFGGPDMKTLYATARTSLYAVKMDVAGHMFPGGKK